MKIAVIGLLGLTALIIAMAFDSMHRKSSGFLIATLQRTAMMPDCPATAKITRESSAGADYSQTIEVEAAKNCLTAWQANLAKSPRFALVLNGRKPIYQHPDAGSGDEGVYVSFDGDSIASVELEEI